MQTNWENGCSFADFIERVEKWLMAVSDVPVVGLSSLCGIFALFDNMFVYLIIASMSAHVIVFLRDLIQFMTVIIIINQAGLTITCNSQLHEFDWFSYDLLILGCLRIFSLIQKLSHLYDLFGYNLVLLSLLVTLDAGFD